MRHADQHRQFPLGTIVIAADGQRLGNLRTVNARFVLVSQDGAPHADLEVPPHAVVRFDGERLYSTVNREVVSIVDDVAPTARLLHIDDA